MTLAAEQTEPAGGAASGEWKAGEMDEILGERVREDSRAAGLARDPN
jgi:hypothetical protein